MSHVKVPLTSAEYAVALREMQSDKQAQFEMFRQEVGPKLSTLSGRPAHPGGCYHCKDGTKTCICPGERRAIGERIPGTAGIVGGLGPNPKQAYGDKKLPLHRVPPAAVAYVALGLKDGANKYGPFNWRDQPVELLTYYAASQRHMMAWFDGEETDPDSGNPHLAHAIACLAIMVDAITSGNAIDNRPKPSPYRMPVAP